MSVPGQSEGVSSGAIFHARICWAAAVPWRLSDVRCVLG